VSIIFYTLPQLDDEAVNLYNLWDIKKIYGRENPFSPFSGYTGNIGLLSENGSIKGNALRETQFNFTLAVSPITSDLPSVFMGRNDKSGDTHIYADNEGFEDVELQLMKKDGKYYCKYRTGKKSYPENYKDSWAEFTPASQSISFQVVSTKRADSGDKTGVNLSLINNTDMALRVFIINDDKTSSRINLKKQEGSIFVIKE
jgi:type IV pilus assembly protein PilO